MESLKIELVGRWPEYASFHTRKRIEDIISWRIDHDQSWYPRPGRTLYVIDESCGLTFKVKGSGFYNPGNVSSSGLKRTTVPVPEGARPMRPLQQAFKRDLIHVDPFIEPPHEMRSVHSSVAPVGGMTLAVAQNDQLMFSRLNAAGLVANGPMVVFKYLELYLGDEPMGVSISRMPAGALRITPYELYLGWQDGTVDDESITFLKQLAKIPNFTMKDPTHRLQVLATIAERAGRAILLFSTSAKLYRFSGSPDNWNMRVDSDSPLFFSDVDTSRTLDSILPTQWAWEVLRNLLSAIHQWVYYFIPCLTYEESGYSLNLLRATSHDFLKTMLSGFFEGTDGKTIASLVDSIWEYLSPALRELNSGLRLPLRGGEHFLQQYISRPIFYFELLNRLAEVIQGSEFQKAFPMSDTTVSGIRNFVQLSKGHHSHESLFGK